jgi:hypothetical protein
MQTANIMVALGGDLGNTVPKYDVTTAEIAVLRAIHGDDAVFDIQPVGEVPMRNRDELQRLKLLYGGAKDRENKPHVEILYPGAAARVFETLDELDLSPEQFASTARASLPQAQPKAEPAPKAAPVVTDEVEDLDALSVEPQPAADEVEIEEEEPSAAEKAKAARAAKAAAKAAKKDELFA